MNRRIVNECLSAGGARVEEAETVESALGKLRDGHPDGQPYRMLVLDSQMPDGCGLNLLDSLSKASDCATLPIILLGRGERYCFCLLYTSLESSLHSNSPRKFAIPYRVHLRDGFTKSYKKGAPAASIERARVRLVPSLSLIPI